MGNIPYFEDIIKFYFHFNLRKLFPKKCSNKIIVYFIGFFHLLGAIILQYGPFFLIPSLLPFYIFYTLLNLLGYFIFSNKCFMTLLSNYYGKLNMENNPHRMRWNTVKTVLLFNLSASIVGFLIPSLAPIYWFQLVTKI